MEPSASSSSPPDSDEAVCCVLSRGSLELLRNVLAPQPVEVGAPGAREFTRRAFIALDEIALALASDDEATVMLIERRFGVDSPHAHAARARVEQAT